MDRAKLRWVFVGVLAWFLVGCASVPMAPADSDQKAKEFKADSGKAALYIYRNETFGAAIPMTVAVNGKTLGQSAAQTYFRLNLEPGKYKVESHAENVAELTLDLLADRIYYVWQEVKMGLWMARSQLTQVDDAVGRKGVLESKLASIQVGDGNVPPLGTAPATGGATDNTAQRLRDLQSLRNDGTITEEEFQTKRKALLDRM